MNRSTCQTLGAKLYQCRIFNKQNEVTQEKTIRAISPRAALLHIRYAPHAYTIEIRGEHEEIQLYDLRSNQWIQRR